MLMQIFLGEYHPGAVEPGGFFGIGVDGIR